MLTFMSIILLNRMALMDHTDICSRDLMLTGSRRFRLWALFGPPAISGMPAKADSDK
jgi:hypothetical protein